MDKLDTYFASWSDKPFDWHSRNCVHFASEWVRIAAGTEIQLPPGMPTDPRSAVRFLLRHGALVRLVTETLQQAPAAVNFACRGDVVYAETPLGTGMLGIANGSTAAFKSDGCGVVFLPISTATLCWKIQWR